MLSSHEVDLFESSRGRLEAIAYRLLGSATDAEDAVQDTFLRWQAADREHIETPEAWLTKVLSNVCLNQLSSARARREKYVGSWLPEPLLAGDRMLGPAETAEQRELVSMAVLTLMERLSPNERVVYVLREAFGYPHGEIARILDITEANCQQIYRRARQHVSTDRTRIEIDASAAKKIAEEFLAAAVSGDTEPLVRLLTDDAVSMSDGGGRVPARSTPVVGALGIARFLRGVFAPNDAKRATFEALVGGSFTMHAVVVNDGPGVLVTVGERVVGVMSLDVTPDGVAAIHVQANPEKLERVTRQWAASDRGEPSGPG
ncbi:MULTISPECIES: RNA polymerase sigma factor SigJ [unclassified Plantactinospora]|uniref:RNA polymerase sigma factor SigJ n=1 Tax=unclassified Plantactinospora TaxID=2631981 RepID=UPI000D1590BD|nr:MULTISPECIES: RNA polymerase sigma factor SigJ [unclassified Plantactinospora]AVT34472.1 RNA polymerase subunit sigma-70 [Plantactinospora sp. BC1]AVT41350.1 RNA polymerase subunit sigma-70 [Plantactinospora sp. BB1]